MPLCPMPTTPTARLAAGPGRTAGRLAALDGLKISCQNADFVLVPHCVIATIQGGKGKIMLAIGKLRWTVTDGLEFVLAVNSQTGNVVTAAPRPGVRPWSTDDREYAETVAEDLEPVSPRFPFRVEAT